MSQPEWMQKFKQIGLKSQEAVVTVDESGEIVKTGETETSRFEKFDKHPRDSAANATPPPWLQQQQQKKISSKLPPPKRPDVDHDEDAAALFAAAASKPAVVNTEEEEQEDAAALFAAAGSQPAVRQTTDDDDAAALFAAAGAVKSSSISAEEEEMVEKYRKMMKMGMPEGAVIQKMSVDEVPPHIQEIVLKPATTEPPGLSAEDEQMVEKYQKMMKMGMPEGAVIQKMSVDEVPPHIQEIVPKPPPAAPTPADPPGLSPEEEAEMVDKYRKMMKMGMPEGAVIQKMSVDEVPSHIQEIVLKPTEETTTTTTPTPTPAPEVVATTMSAPSGATVTSIDTHDAQSIEEEIFEDEEVIEESVIEESMVEESVVSSSMIEESVVSGSVKGSLSAESQQVPPPLQYQEQEQVSIPPHPSEQKMSDEEFGEPWVVDKDRVLHDLNRTRYEEVEVARDTGDVHYDEVYFDENGNQVLVGHPDRGIEPEEVHDVYVDEDGNTIDEDILVEETVELPPVEPSSPVPPPPPPPVVQSQAIPQQSREEAPPPVQTISEPPYDPAYDIESQRKLLQRGSKTYRSRMAAWVPYVFIFAIIVASLLVVFFVVLADDDGIDVKSIPTAAPTPRDYVPLDPTNTGAIDVAATTPLESVTGNCTFRGIEQPHVIDQCSCDGKITIIANDIRERYESLLDTFMPDVIQDFNQEIDSCDPRNQALIWLSSGTNNAGEAPVTVRRDRYALAYFYLDQGGLEWSDNQGWLSEQDTCQWDRVTCDQNGQVLRLDMSDNQIVGQLSVAISLMENLEYFSAAQNNIEGTIPPEFFSTPKLRSLDLSSNSLFGVIPSFPEGSVLEIINFSSNNLSGKIDSSIENAKSLLSLNLASNALNRGIPTEMFSLPLQELYLESNFLTGTIPDSIGGLSDLTSLSLGPNTFTGVIPTSIGDLTNLTQLVIQDVPQLTGRLPAQYGLQLTNLVEFVLTDTSISGNIPEQFGMMSSLEKLDLGRNSLGRVLPTELGMLTNLRTLNLENNAFTGSLPSELGNARQLTEVQLQTNQLIGTIPSSFGQLSQLVTLRLDTNFLDGRAPTEICSLRQGSLNEFTVDCPERVSDTLVVGIICTVPTCCTQCF